MKKLLSAALTVSLCLTAGAALAIDTYNDSDPANGIGSSRHNLGAFSLHINTPNVGVGTGTTELCVFCHTPHHANGYNTALIGDPLAPLWNRGSLAPTSFTAYGTTAANTSILNTDIGSISLACLSCHDGTTTFDTIVNAPGNSTNMTGIGVDQGWTFFDGGVVVSDFMTSTRLNIGLDLSNDHPMSVVYNGGTKASLRPTDTLISAIDLTSDMASSVLTYDNGNLTKNLWAVGGFIKASARISDLLRDGTYSGLGDRVECSSCHDPHFNNKSFNEIDSTYSTDIGAQEDESNGLFLRRVGGNSGSGVCRTCHAK